MTNPSVSIVVICFTTPAHLRRTLRALIDQASAIPIEILVPHDDTLDDVPGLKREFTDVRFLRSGAAAPPAQLRAFGTHAATAPIVAYLEDHCYPSSDWVGRIVALHQSNHAAIGGAIDKGFPPGASDDTTLNWAVYLADYSRYMPPMPSGETHALSDCNVSYKRSALAEVADVWAVEFHENLVNGALGARGKSLWFDPSMLVFEQRTLTLRQALRDRFSFGRLFGSGRVEGAPFGRRLALSAIALAMPPLLVARVARNLLSRKRYLATFVRTLPLLSLVAATWMLGESVGYFTGRAGRALTPAR